MPIIEYTPDRFDDLQEMVSHVHDPLNLAHRPFVDYYYATREFCKLYLYYSNSGKIIGTLGREIALVAYAGQQIKLRIGSNWYSLQRGVGGELSEHSLRANPNSIGLMFSGSQATLDILQHRKWIFMPGIRGYYLNNPCTIYAVDPWWRATPKHLVRRLARKPIGSFAGRLPASAKKDITVQEENEYYCDLLPKRSPFMFRFAPTIEYLRWRYNLSLPFIRYRVFRLLVRGRTSGYVILSDAPHQITVAQCDAEDPAALAYGVLVSVLAAGSHDSSARTVFLACCHPEMQTIYQDFGFRPQRGSSLPFAFRTPPPNLNAADGTSNWLVNFDWGDNGLRPPFTAAQARGPEPNPENQEPRT